MIDDEDAYYVWVQRLSDTDLLASFRRYETCRTGLRPEGIARYETLRAEVLRRGLS